MPLQSDFHPLFSPDNGPWKAAQCYSDYDNWYIFNVDTGAHKKIGKIGAKRANYFTDACNEASRRNNLLAVKAAEAAISCEKVSA
jgi:hypothetical protein